MARLIEIDGAEGGGSVLRVGIGLSVALQVPVRVVNQIIPFLALHGGSFRCREITDHIRINLAIAEQITGRRFTQQDGRITC